MHSGYTILDHPADLGIEARGQSLSEAFGQAAIALISTIADLATVEPRTARSVHLTASDREQLLVKWLGEILYLYDGQEFLCKEFTIDRLTNTALVAIVKGELLDPDKHRTMLDVKAITYHQLSVREDEQGAVVRVFLDI
jgi:SHS2 domain-containing protein